MPYPDIDTGKSPVEALRDKDANLFFDLALHNMGPGLADDVSQGNAAGDEFRTAPLWGLGKRIFFLHDGRTKDLLEAIQAHAGFGGGQYVPLEANQVVGQFNRLNEIKSSICCISFVPCEAARRVCGPCRAFSMYEGVEGGGTSCCPKPARS